MKFDTCKDHVYVKYRFCTFAKGLKNEENNS